MELYSRRRCRKQCWPKWSAVLFNKVPKYLVQQMHGTVTNMFDYWTDQVVVHLPLPNMRFVLSASLDGEVSLNQFYSISPLTAKRLFSLLYDDELLMTNLCQTNGSRGTLSTWWCLSRGKPYTTPQHRGFLEGACLVSPHYRFYLDLTAVDRDKSGGILL